MARLFFGLRPDDHVRRAIQAFARTLPPGASGRLVAEKNTHITLAFLGSVDAPTGDCVRSAAASVRAAPFSLCLDTLGWWQKPRVAFLAPSSLPDELSRLAASLQGLCRDCGVAMPDRPYRPHLTLARKVNQRPPDLPVPPIRWDIREFCLLESSTRPEGVEYQVRAGWPLKIM